MAGNDWLYEFVQDGAISEDQLDEALAITKRRGGNPEDVLVGMGYLDAEVVAAKKAKAFGFATIDLDSMEIPHSLIELVPESVARENVCIPVEFQGERLIVAVADAMNLELLDKLRFILNRDVELTTAGKESILAAINRHYGQGEGESVDSMIVEFTETAIDFTDTEMNEAASALKNEESSPIVKLVNLIFNEAVNMRASDIHIEPFEDRIRIRYRIDGHLVQRDSPPRRLLAALTSRIKVMARMDIAEKRRPQDGRIKTRAGGKEIDLRVSVLPSAYGQAIVLRILDRDNIKIGIRNMGFSEENYRRFHSIIRRPNGIFLVTGPTGSGKTTTLYSALGELNRPDRKIITAEDPVEYYLPGINQVEVKHNIGLDFARIIRAMLRQAPNVILVGEIRDTETGEMAIQASLTGHLVFSTLHTNDAPGAITRLIDMGVQPFLVASSLMAVMAQRLIRTNCPKCAAPFQPDATELGFFELTPDQIANATFRKGTGCKNCQQTGYRGRKAVFELMMINSVIRDQAFRSEPAQNIRRTARLYGMKTLVEDAVDKALEGVSTLMEAYKLRSGGH